MNSRFDSFLARVGRKRLANLLGMAILLVGLGWAGWIWHSAEAAPDDLSSLGLSLSPEDSARYQRDVEVYYGKLGLLTDKWTRQLETLSHGKPLAELVAVLSTLAATACFFFAPRLQAHRRPTADGPARAPSGESLR